MDDITPGGAVEVSDANRGQGANSPTSPQSARPHTTKTEKSALDIKTRLEILQQAILDYRMAGGRVDLADLRPKREAVAIVLSGVSYNVKEGVLTQSEPGKAEP